MSAPGAPLGVQSGGPRLTRHLARRSWSVVVSATFVTLLPILAIAAPLIAPDDPRRTDLGDTLAGGSGQHWLGTDALGRDILSRLIYASRTSLIGPLAIVAISGTIGVAIALWSTWRRGRFDSAVTGALDVLLGFPALLLALIAVAAFGLGLLAPIVALGIAYTPYFARLIRSVALRERSAEYVSALTLAGYGGVRITLKHILPNIVPFVLTQAALMFAYAIVDLAAVSYLGLGVQPPTPDWGSMVAAGQNSVLQNAPQESLSAGALIVLAVIALNILSEGMAGRTAGGRE